MTDAVNPLGRFDLPFAEQIDFFRRKTNLGTQAWTDIWEAQHDRSFVVAGAMKADLLNEIRQAVDKAIATGTTLETFRKEFRDITDRLGWPGTAGAGSKGGFNWRTKVIYETNLRTSYAAGREAQLADPGLQALLPFRRYVHNDSVLHPRPLHLAWNGLTLPHDHPFWQTHSPPNGWGCRCRVTAVAAPRKGDATKPPAGWDDMLEDTGAPPGIDKGWGYAPGASVRDELRALVEQKVAKLPEPLGKALAADVEAVLRPEKPGALRALNTDLLSRAGADAPGVEYAGLVGADGKLLWTKRGGKSHVSFTAQELADMNGGVLSHNHPTSQSLSVQDLFLVMEYGLKRIYAVGPDGSVYAASIKNNIGRGPLKKAHEAAERSVRKGFYEKINAGEISPDDAMKFHWHAVNLMLSKRGFVRYRAAVKAKTPGWVYDVIGRMS